MSSTCRTTQVTKRPSPASSREMHVRCCRATRSALALLKPEQAPFFRWDGLLCSHRTIGTRGRSTQAWLAEQGVTSANRVCVKHGNREHVPGWPLCVASVLTLAPDPACHSRCFPLEDFFSPLLSGLTQS